MGMRSLHYDDVVARDIGGRGPTGRGESRLGGRLEPAVGNELGAAVGESGLAAGGGAGDEMEFIAGATGGSCADASW